MNHSDLKTYKKKTEKQNDYLETFKILSRMKIINIDELETLNIHINTPIPNIQHNTSTQYAKRSFKQDHSIKL